MYNADRTEVTVKGNSKFTQTSSNLWFTILVSLSPQSTLFKCCSSSSPPPLSSVWQQYLVRIELWHLIIIIITIIFMIIITKKSRLASIWSKSSQSSSSSSSPSSSHHHYHNHHHHHYCHYHLIKNFHYNRFSSPSSSYHCHHHHHHYTLMANIITIITTSIITIIIIAPIIIHKHLTNSPKLASVDQSLPWCPALLPLPVRSRWRPQAPGKSLTQAVWRTRGGGRVTDHGSSRHSAACTTLHCTHEESWKTKWADLKNYFISRTLFLFDNNVHNIHTKKTKMKG